MSDDPEKIVHLNATKDINWRALLAQIAESKDVEAVVAVTLINGRWVTCWGSGEGNLDCGGLSMAALRLMRDVTEYIHE